MEKLEKLDPLFSPKEITAAPKEEVINQGIINNDISHEFFISENYKHFYSQLTEIEQNKLYTFMSFGNWSLKHVVFHLLKLAGKSNVWSTTYGLGPNAAKGIVSGLNNGLIDSFNFLYDNKIKSYKVEAHDICISNFPVKICSIHAKITVLLNKNWGVTISGSANWSDSNNKIETTIISTNRNLALFHKKWIDAAMKSKSADPKQILKEIKHIFK